MVTLMTWHSLERFGTEFAFWICAFAIGLAVVFRKDQKRRDTRSSQQIAMDRTNAYNERRARTEKTHSSPTYTHTRKF